MDWCIIMKWVVEVVLEIFGIFKDIWGWVDVKLFILYLKWVILCLFVEFSVWWLLMSCVWIGFGWWWCWFWCLLFVGWWFDCVVVRLVCRFVWLFGWELFYWNMLVCLMGWLGFCCWGWLCCCVVVFWFYFWGRVLGVCISWVLMWWIGCRFWLGLSFLD